MLFLLLRIRTEPTREDFVLNLKSEWIKKLKRWKYIKMSGKILKLGKGINWILGVRLKRLIFKSNYIYTENIEWTNISSFYFAFQSNY